MAVQIWVHCLPDPAYNEQHHDVYLSCIENGILNYISNS